MTMRILIAVLVIGAIAAAVFVLSRRSAPDDMAWRTYKQRFVMTDGRVADTGNGGVSHTEGQSYAMLLAVAYNDRETFDRVWGWTRQTLRRPDGLFSWRYMPGADTPIADRNNATDGDLVMCWALIRAAETWNRTEDRNAAADLAAALRHVVVRDGDNAFLLPGVDGFTGDNKRVVNLSYWVFPALKAIASFTRDPMWQQVVDTGLRLIERARFGAHNLPPDWLETAGDLRPADGFPPRFGYDAVRIPLYVTWGGVADASRLDPIRTFWTSTSQSPAWVDLITGEVSPETQSPGMAAVRRLTLDKNSKSAGNADLPTGDYYSTSLLMLTRVMEQDRAKPQ